MQERKVIILQGQTQNQSLIPLIVQKEDIEKPHIVHPSRSQSQSQSQSQTLQIIQAEASQVAVGANDLCLI